jgi:hypothetical protein
VNHPKGESRKHDSPCPATGAEYLLRDVLQEIQSAAGWNQRFLVLFFDIKNEGDWGSDLQLERMDKIEIELLDHLATENRFYKYNDFQLDYRWPSISEFVAMGKHFVCFYDENNDSYIHDFLFITAQTQQEAETIASDTGEVVGLINRENGDIGGGNIPSATDGWLWRSYYVDYEEDWIDSIQKGFNFIAGDCITDAWTFSELTHPPVPTYVNAMAPCFGFPLLCAGTFGTLTLPYASVPHLDVCPLYCIGQTTEMALERLAEHSDIVFAGGEYTGTFIIDKPMTIRLGGSGLGSEPGSAFIGANSKQDEVVAH